MNSNGGTRRRKLKKTKKPEVDISLQRNQSVVELGGVCRMMPAQDRDVEVGSCPSVSRLFQNNPPPSYELRATHEEMYVNRFNRSNNMQNAFSRMGNRSEGGEYRENVACSDGNMLYINARWGRHQTLEPEEHNSQENELEGDNSAGSKGGTSGLKSRRHH